MLHLIVLAGAHNLSISSRTRTFVVNGDCKKSSLPDFPAGAVMQQETSSPRLLNDDLAPSTKRTWGAYSITSVWFGVVHNIGNYTLAAGMLLIGLPAWQ